MPKLYTFPTLFDEVKTVDISFLKEHNYLQPNQIKRGAIHWSLRGEDLGSISILVDTKSNEPHVELDYKCNGELIKYKVYLHSTQSNLGKGQVYYFRCPKTHKYCRKLYLVDSLFLHREAFKGCMYESQTYSKKMRSLNNTLFAFFDTDRYYSQLYKKHFKKTYAGKPTKKYLRLMGRIHKAESVDLRFLERALLVK